MQLCLFTTKRSMDEREETRDEHATESIGSKLCRECSRYGLHDIAICCSFWLHPFFSFKNQQNRCSTSASISVQKKSNLALVCLFIGRCTSSKFITELWEQGEMRFYNSTKSKQWEETSLLCVLFCCVCYLYISPHVKHGTSFGLEKHVCIQSCAPICRRDAAKTFTQLTVLVYLYGGKYISSLIQLSGSLLHTV